MVCARDIVLVYMLGQAQGSEPASIAYRYRKWKIGGATVIARCEINAYMQNKQGENQFLLVKALNESDSKSGPDWRRTLVSQACCGAGYSAW